MKRFSVLLSTVAILFFCRIVPAQTIEVNEKATRLVLREGGNQLTFAVRNLSSEVAPGHLRIEVLDSDGTNRSQTEQDVTIAPGANRITVPFSFWSQQATVQKRETLWDRLRYIFEFKNAKLVPVSGVVAAAEIAPQPFELETWRPQYVIGDSVYRVRVHTRHPVTGQAAAGVEVEGKLEFHDQHESVLDSKAATDRNGNAVLAFNIPDEQPADSPELTVTASRDGVERKVSPDLALLYPGDACITTDKPIYQPGQMLHMRALLISESKHARANAHVVLTVTSPDPDNEVVFRETLESSRFGIVHADWQIPENQPRGDYRIQIKPDSNDDSRHWSSEAFVTVSRYELPNFVVNAKPDRAYYLPGQNAEVEVHGDYLFGKPVTHGHVRVVREESHRWNYKEQKWETEEGEDYQGELDANGRFTARVELKKAEDDLSDDRYERFQDLHFAAYITDATTGRTEQRRFDVRLTRDAIHIYYVPDGDERPELPLNFYLAAQYADGSPCECDIAITRLLDRKTGSGYQQQSWAWRTVHTNRYGLAHVTGLKWSQLEEDSGRWDLRFEARDGHGASGRREEGTYFPDDDVIRVRADKALYRDQEPINIEIESNSENSALVVEVSSHSKLIETEVVHLRNGHAALTVPYSPQFQDNVDIWAHDMRGSKTSYGDWRLAMGSRTVLYPRKHELNLSVRLKKAVFRPGEDAQADLRVQGPNGEDVEGALALAVTDKAVDARARTEREFSFGYRSWFWRYWSDRENVAGFSRSDLDKVDLNQPYSADLDLVAELLLRNGYPWDSRPERDVSGEMLGIAYVFQRGIHAAISPFASALRERFAKDGEYPRDEETLKRLLGDAGLKREEIRDPWGTTYHTRFYSEREFDKMTFISAGPDKVFGTDDDFVTEAVSWPYSQPYGSAIDKAAQEYHRRTHGFIRDEATLKAELRNQGIDWSEVKDRWGQPYVLLFGVSARYETITVMSGGPDKGYHNKDPYYDSDDFHVWTSQQDFLTDLEREVKSALSAYYNKTLIFPETQSQLEKALAAAGIDFNSEKMRDPWGAPYYAVFDKESVYSDEVKIQSTSGSQHEQTTPVTVRLKTVRLRSSGPNKVQGDRDDFTLTEFSVMVSEQSAKDAVPQAPPKSIVLAHNNGAIAGTVTDATGAVVAGTSVKVVSDLTGEERAATSDQVGEFLFTDLPPGSYRLRCEYTGFKISQVTDIHVFSKEVVRVNVTLEVGASAEAVEVTAEPSLMNTSTTNSSVVERVATLGRDMAKLLTIVPGLVAAPPISTPRLREYFPETLVWQPELITDRHGRSHVNFKVADNITSWKLSVLASDANGQIGSAEKEFTAFQPFFADLDPPPVLTQNDEISLPVVLRNYLGKPQQVKADMKPESWFTLLGSASQQAEVPAGDSKNTIFPFRAIAAVHEGKQRVTAIGGDASDAIERKVSVHPDGEEQVITQGQIFSSNAQFKTVLPDDLIPNSVHAELKIYPNLMAHVMESIEGSLERPYGCGEQTISSTYPNLLVLKAYKAQGIQGPNAALALRYLQKGYERLLTYRSSEGGFSYWGRGEPNLALTTYAIQFLNDAREFIAVDEDVISSAREWVLGQQDKSGAWQLREGYGGPAYKSWYQLSTTSYITRVLAETLGPEEKKQSPSLANLIGQLHQALDYLASEVQKTDEPYFIANYALAASALGEHVVAAAAQQRLITLTHEANGEAWWELERNTPFYGWGTAGSVETTALVLRALPQNDERAKTLALNVLRFLFREKDRYGVWYSGQATVNVLKTLIALPDAAGAMTQGENPVEIKVNGKTVKSVTIPAGNQIVAPIIVDLSEFLAAGENQVQLAGAEAARSSAQLVASYYVPWSSSKTATETGEKHGNSDILRLAVHYDRAEIKIGDQVHCSVEVERIGFRGWGMMLAEIGLPPAADVDRESLDKAIANAGWSLDHYDILPDRLIAYVWPHYQGGATKFDFTFRPRMGEKAQTAPSTLYDYYNPEAHAVVAPTRFTVH
jgi:uncharacterized protein YfaS (alpha-2-macroglobulin family)